MDTKFILPESTKKEIANLSKWARYISITGFVVGGITILFGVFTGLISLGLFHLGVSADVLAQLPSWVAILTYTVIVGAYFIPFLLLYNFSLKSRAAIVMDSEKMLNIALNNLHQCFRFTGVITFTFISLYIIIQVGAGVAFILGLL
jgi:hypothetical protein